MPAYKIDYTPAWAGVFEKRLLHLFHETMLAELFDIAPLGNVVLSPGPDLNVFRLAARACLWAQEGSEPFVVLPQFHWLFSFRRALTIGCYIDDT